MPSKDTRVVRLHKPALDILGKYSSNCDEAILAMKAQIDSFIGEDTINIENMVRSQK